MDLGQASKLAGLHKEIKEAPSSNPEFKDLSTEEKMSNLGLRIAAITQDSGKNVGYREFLYSFTTGDGAEVKLELSAHYGDSLDTLTATRAFDIAAIWSSGGQSLAIEGVSEAFMRDHPDKVDAMFDRLDESVSAAEELYAQTSA